jgi:choline-sulfatase
MAAKPNFVFIFADDQAYNTIGALGNDEIRTPHLDRLVKEGTTFTHAYNMGAWHGAICVASRTMLNTGKTVWRARELEKTLNKTYAATGKSWAQRMEKVGYQTRMTGKWHVKLPADKSFQKAVEPKPGMPKTVKSSYNRPIEGQKDAWSPYDKSIGGFWEGGKHWSEVVADHGISFIDEMKKSDDPFFMYLAFNAPHDPRQSPKPFVDMYPYKDVSLPLPFYKEFPFDIGSNKIRDEKLAPFPRTEYAVKVNRAEYYAIITHMDEHIGRILDAVEASGEKDNTWIVFTADHGLGCGHHGLMGKQNQFDHSVRVPFMVVGPGIAKGKKISTPIYLQDVMATALDLADADKEGVEFKSLLPQIQGKSTKHYDAIYGSYTTTQRMVTADHHKLIVYPKVKREQLFDLKKDPLEEKDLSKNPEYAEVKKKLYAKLKALQKELGDPLKL